MSIDPRPIRYAIDTRLPRHARWIVRGTPLDFEFYAERDALRRLTERDVVGGPVPEAWSDCLVFGRDDFAEGGGASAWITIRESDGFVCGVDIERVGETVFVFNSSLDRFITTFLLIDPHLRGGRELPPGVVMRVMALDPDVFPASDWMGLIELVGAH